jgi:aminoglycoside phosphotransferase (APT) family kinase protein
VAATGSGSAWSDFLARTLTEGADGYCLHDTLRERGGEPSRLLSWIQSVGRSVRSLPQGDLVHFDFHHRNILRSAEGALTVVDCEGFRPGDRAFDLVTFCFGMSHAAAPLGTEDPLWERATALASVEALTAYMAHMTLRRLDWTLRHHGEHELARLWPIVRKYVALVEGPSEEVPR